jgi:hypothetical protein
MRIGGRVDEGIEGGFRRIKGGEQRKQYTGSSYLRSSSGRERLFYSIGSESSRVKITAFFVGCLAHYSI